MTTGSVYKTKYGNIIIITSVSEDYANWVSFSHSNSCGGSHIKTRFEESQCWTCDINDGGEQDDDCVCCHGTGYYNKEIYGLEEAEFLGPTVKDYILKSLTANFKF